MHMSMKATGKKMAGKMVNPPQTICPKSAAIRTITNDTELRTARTKAMIPTGERLPMRTGRAG